MHYFSYLKLTLILSSFYMVLVLYYVQNVRIENLLSRVVRNIFMTVTDDFTVHNLIFVFKNNLWE
jgi:hypothetical protein